MAGLPRWFHQFCGTADRHDVLATVLTAAGVAFDEVPLGPHRHLVVASGRPATPQSGEKVLLAHYDRVAGAPGANDNGASVLALVDYLRRPHRAGRPLRVVFTDGEELSADAPLASQGSHALARTWPAGLELFPVVLDMTGIGDTFVLGHGAEALWRSRHSAPPPTNPDAFARVRLRARRFLATCGAGDAVEIDTPFSDDLGLFLAGFPSVQLSLLPRKQALAYKKTGGELPPAWRTMHTPYDTLDALWPQARALVGELLDKLEDYPI